VNIGRLVISYQSLIEMEMAILPLNSIVTARCTLVQSAVLRSHAVCLSVRLPVRLSVRDVGGL